MVRGRGPLPHPQIGVPDANGGAARGHGRRGRRPAVRPDGSGELDRFSGLYGAVIFRWPRSVPAPAGPVRLRKPLAPGARRRRPTGRTHHPGRGARPARQPGESRSTAPGTVSFSDEQAVAMLAALVLGTPGLVGLSYTRTWEGGTPVFSLTLWGTPHPDA